VDGSHTGRFLKEVLAGRTAGTARPKGEPPPTGPRARAGKNGTRTVRARSAARS
jgi:hypothetical protein